jgi:hypothetical protein
MFAIALALAACDGSADEDSASDPDEEYPLVTVPPQVGGPLKPSATEAEAGTTCERMIVPSPQGPQELVFPPPPGLAAEATSDRDVLLTWSVGELPEACRPVHMLLSIVAFGNVRASPTVVEEPVKAASGTASVTYPDFLPLPDVAYAAVYSSDGRSSRTTSVLIRR